MKTNVIPLSELLSDYKDWTESEAKRQIIWDNMEIERGRIFNPNLKTWADLDEKTRSAIQYLCEEWDYEYVN